MTEPEEPNRIERAIERIGDILASIPPTSWLDAIIRGPVGPPD